jgi:hypothetical protein
LKRQGFSIGKCNVNAFVIYPFEVANLLGVDGDFAYLEIEHHDFFGAVANRLNANN